MIGASPDSGDGRPPDTRGVHAAAALPRPTRQASYRVVEGRSRKGTARHGRAEKSSGGPVHRVADTDGGAGPAATSALDSVLARCRSTVRSRSVSGSMNARRAWAYAEVPPLAGVEALPLSTSTTPPGSTARSQRRRPVHQPPPPPSGRGETSCSSRASVGDEGPDDEDVQRNNQ